jgi:hypothetical protein
VILRGGDKAERSEVEERRMDTVSEEERLS